MTMFRSMLLVGTVVALAAPAVAATAWAQEAPRASCEATSLSVLNDTAGTRYAAFDADSTPFEAYDITLTPEGSDEAFGRSQVAPGDTFESGPTGPGRYNLSAVPIEAGGQPNLSLIYSGDLTLSCEQTSSVFLVDFLGGTSPTAEDDGVTGSDIPVPTRIETGAGGAAPVV